MSARLRRLLTLTAASSLVGVATGCTTVVNPPTAPASAQPTRFNAQAVTVAGCQALAQWENGPSTGTEADAATSTQVQAIITRSAGTQFSSDLDTWVVDLQTGDTTDASPDADTVDADCAAVGVPNVIGG